MFPALCVPYWWVWSMVFGTIFVSVFDEKISTYVHLFESFFLWPILTCEDKKFWQGYLPYKNTDYHL